MTWREGLALLVSVTAASAVFCLGVLAWMGL